MFTVYKLLLPETNQFYVGSTGQYEKRIRRHRRELNEGRHHCKPFQQSYNQHPSIEGTVLVICDTLEEAREIEQTLILSNLYNKLMLNVSLGTNGGDNLTRNPDRIRIIKKIVDSLNERFIKLSTEERKRIYGRSGKENAMYGKRHSEESKTMMSIASTGKVAPNKGVPMSDAHRAKLMEHVKTRDYSGDKNPFAGKKHSKETIELIRKSNTGRVSVTKKTLMAGGKQYDSATVVAGTLGICNATVTYRCKSDKYKDWYYLN